MRQQEVRLGSPGVPRPPAGAGGNRETMLCVLLPGPVLEEEYIALCILIQVSHPSYHNKSPFARFPEFGRKYQWSYLMEVEAQTIILEAY